ncbi:very short patch repair endonuclease [Nocardia asiatica]|uniref:very short patch repair endonuclease n=1 Tax=Nocardia asiatica TaxID=209252 RepID=UPI003EE18404
MTLADMKWNNQLPPDRAWKCPRGLNRAERAAEQDRAAGGRYRRLVALEDGRTSLASIELKVYAKTRRIRAYVRWSDNGKYPTRYVGEVNGRTRRQNLVQAWGLVADRALIRNPSTPAGSWASSPSVRSVMRGNKSRDTRPELELRAAIRQQGLGYRVDMRPLTNLRRRADIVFVGPKVAVFCDGCFWHGCPDHHRPADKNSEFWRSKIDDNRARDVETNRLLEDAGWLVIRVWEHEDPQLAAVRITNAVSARRSSGSGQR